MKLLVMVTNGIIVAPVTTTDVSNTIGTSTHSISELVANARTGGSNGKAFWIRENAIDRANEGKLIDGALPYWNIYSADSPGEFYATGGSTTQGELKFRIKLPEIQPDNKRYSFKLGVFRNYFNGALYPSIYGKTNLDITISNGNYTPLVLDYYISPGSYDWGKVLGYVTGYMGIFLCKEDGTVFDHYTTTFTKETAHIQKNLRWTMDPIKVKQLYNGQKLYPKIFIAQSNITNTNDGFIITSADTSSAISTVNIENQSPPSFGTLFLYDSVRDVIFTEANGVTYTRPSLTQDEKDITITNIKSTNFTVTFAQNRFIQYRKNGGPWQGATAGSRGAINGSSSYTAYTLVDGGLTYNVQYDIRIYVGDTPPRE